MKLYDSGVYLVNGKEIMTDAAEVQQKTQEGYDPWMVYNMNQEVRLSQKSRLPKIPSLMVF